MFSKRGALGSNRAWDKGFVVELATDLTNAGFKDITVKLPVDLEILVRDEIPVKSRVKSEIKSREISLKRFVDNERNYPAVIIVAQNKQKKEMIKILFVNISTKTNFMDVTFPSGHSEPSQLYIQSPDPARVYSLYHFFMEYLDDKSESRAGGAFLNFFALIFLSAELLSFVGTRKGFLQNVWNYNGWVDLLITTFILFFQYRFFKSPTGLSVNKRETATVGSFLQRAIKGEFKDNPLVTIILGVLATILSALILRILGLL